MIKVAPLSFLAMKWFSVNSKNIEVSLTRKSFKSSSCSSKLLLSVLTHCLYLIKSSIIKSRAIVPLKNFHPLFAQGTSHSDAKYSLSFPCCKRKASVHPHNWGNVLTVLSISVTFWWRVHTHIVQSSNTNKHALFWPQESKSLKIDLEIWS